MAYAIKTAADLKAHHFAANPRTITQERLQTLGSLMDNLGDLGGVTFNRRTGNLVSGHQRTKNMPDDAGVIIVEEYDQPNAQGTVAIGYIDVDGERWAYREVDVDPELELAMNIAANNPQVQGEFDFKLLADHMVVLDSSGMAQLTGFDDLTVESLLTWSPPSREETAQEHGESRHDDLWPEIKMRVSPETHARWKEVIDALPAADDDGRIILLLDKVEEREVAEA